MRQVALCRQRIELRCCATLSSLIDCLSISALLPACCHVACPFCTLHSPQRLPRTPQQCVHACGRLSSSVRRRARGGGGGLLETQHHELFHALCIQGSTFGAICLPCTDCRLCSLLCACCVKNLGHAGVHCGLLSTALIACTALGTDPCAVHGPRRVPAIGSAHMLIWNLLLRSPHARLACNSARLTLLYDWTQVVKA